MNKTIQYNALVTTGGANVAEVAPIPLIVPEGMAFRCRYFEVRLRTGTPGDRDSMVGLTQRNQDTARVNDAAFLSYNAFLALASWEEEHSGSAGIVAYLAVHRVDLWDMDYRLVMPPTMHILGLIRVVTACGVLAGELVKATEGQRNAIIGWQGGLH